MFHRICNTPGQSGQPLENAEIGMGRHLPKKKYFITLVIVAFVTVSILSFHEAGKPKPDDYKSLYLKNLYACRQNGLALVEAIRQEDITGETGKENILKRIAATRLGLKAADFWLRYLEPTAYLRMNGQLPVEWETEVFEKFEKPYRREGAGLSLAEMYLEEKHVQKDSLAALASRYAGTIDVYLADSITSQLNSHHHFYLANRLFLLNLAAIYTTGFECPDTKNIIPELRHMMKAVEAIYDEYDKGFPGYPIPEAYRSLYRKAMLFVESQPENPEEFDHYAFTRDYVNPLFGHNQRAIREYAVVSSSFNDYSLNDNCNSIFDKSLYRGQNEKGIFLPVDDANTLNEIRQVGKLLFYDPILSGNNKRSCVSCHKPGEYFTDTTRPTSQQFDISHALTRNTPTLINSLYNHLLMMDGKHTSLLEQARTVVSNPLEMNGNQTEIVKKVMSCESYEKAFRKFVKLTPNTRKISIDHIVSAVILYYSSFSMYRSPFDDAMDKRVDIDAEARKGFNLFMSKGKCGTCHFVPQFNGVKPPYISSEFEVAGTPADTSFTRLSPDSGRFIINPEPEMLHAFRTGTIRNADHTGPYMHNGVFKTLDEVIRFYDTGGASGNGLMVSNQTLPPDSLKLSSREKTQLKAFIRSLNEDIPFETSPVYLPASTDKNLNSRKVGGEY